MSHKAAINSRRKIKCVESTATRTYPFTAFDVAVVGDVVGVVVGDVVVGFAFAGSGDGVVAFEAADDLAAKVKT